MKRIKGILKVIGHIILLANLALSGSIMAIYLVAAVAANLRESGSEQWIVDFILINMCASVIIAITALMYNSDKVMHMFDRNEKTKEKKGDEQR